VRLGAPTSNNDSVAGNSDFFSIRYGGTGLENPAYASVTQWQSTRHEKSQVNSMARRKTVNMKANLSGRSVRGGGARGSSTSPCSQSGIDPTLVRGKSSHLNFEMHATDKQIQSISRSFQKLRDIRFGRSPAAKIYAAYRASQDFNKPALKSVLNGSKVGANLPPKPLKPQNNRTFSP